MSKKKKPGKSKSSRHYLVKSGSNLVPIAAGRWQCWSGHVNRASAGYCTSCGEYRATTAEQRRERVVKSADPMRAHRLFAEMRAEPDPDRREYLRKRISDETIGSDPARAAAFIAKSSGYASARDLVAAQSDPETAELFRRMSHPWLYGTGGGQVS